MEFDRAVLVRECEVFTRFLVKLPATPYVIDKYVDAHQRIETLVARDWMDRFLVTSARRSPAITRLVDAYARHSVRSGILRKKLVLLLAILETSPPFARSIDSAATGSMPMTLVNLLLSGLIGVLAAVAGTLLLAPLSLIARLRKRPHD